MDQFVWQGNHELPSVVLDAAMGRFEIEGKAVSEDAAQFFGNVQSWLEEYIKAPNAVTNFRFKLDYFNITSSKRILNILYLLEGLAKSGYEVAVDWCYNLNDDKMHEVGQDLACMVTLPFRFHEVSVNKLETAVA